MIGVFDSGVGGLTVLKEIQNILPHYNTVYFGDTARYPYGHQSLIQLRRYAKEDANLLWRHGAKIFVVACNSASVAAADLLRSEFKVPVFDVSRAPSEEAVRITKTKRIGVIGTTATIQSGQHEKLLKEFSPEALVVSKATPLLVPIVEERWWRHSETIRILRRYLKPFKKARIDTLILGCTHYPMLAKQIKRVMGPKVTLVSSARAVAEALKKFLEENPDIDNSISKEGKNIYLVSNDAKHFQDTAEWWLGKKIKAQEELVVNE